MARLLRNGPAMKSGNAEKFGERLRAVMREKGYLSDHSKSGVDVAALAGGAGITYEMARRYCEGTALPRPEKLAAIAKWLSVPPAQLAWGESSGGGAKAINTEILRQCIEAIVAAQARNKRTVTAETAAKLVVILYDEVMMGRAPAEQAIDLMIRAA